MEKSQSLYHLTAELVAIMDNEEEGFDAFAAVDKLAGTIENKIGNCGRFHRYLTDQAAMLKAREQEFAKQRKVLENKAANFKAYIQKCMEAANIDAVVNGDVTAKIKKNPAKVVYAEGFKAPTKFLVKQEPRVDTAGIKDALKAGKKVKGASLKSSFRLDIK